MRADHFAYLVSDMDAAIEFYTGVLGLELLSRDKDEEHGEEFTFLRLEGCNIELLAPLGEGTSKAGTPAPPDPAMTMNCPHLAIKVEDVDGTVESLRRAGANVFKGPMEIPGKVKWAYFTDADGNVLEVVEWL